MQSNNPVFRRSEEFNRAGAGYGNQTYAGYGNPSTWSTGTSGAPADPQGHQSQQGYQGHPTQPGYPAPETHQGYGTTPADTGRMTIDTVVQKTAISLGTVILAALVTWVLTPDLRSTTDPASLGGLYAALTIGSLGAFGLSMVNSFKRVISPALVIAFCVLEGVALGAFSKMIDAFFVQPDQGSIVVQAVIGTFAAFAGTLTAYKVFHIKVGQKFQMIVMAGMFGMVGLGLLELVLGLFGAGLGIFGFGTLGLVFSVVGLVLGVFMLVLDFDFVEQGVANGLPERESWRAAFAMTVSLVWIYTNLLRILAILQDG